MEWPCFRFRASFSSPYVESPANRTFGDAVLAAQKDLAENSVFPELLAIYHLFGDPALVLR